MAAGKARRWQGFVRLVFPFLLWLAGFAVLAPNVALADQTPPDLVPDLENDPASPVIGNANGRLTIIDFFDYRCPFCRVMDRRLRSAVAQSHDIRLIFKEWPVIGGVSVYAAKVAVAAGFQGKYLAVHEALFALHDVTEQSVRAAAAGAGVDMARLDTDLVKRGPEIDAVLARDATEADTLDFLGAPGLVIGSHVSAGALSEPALRALIRAQSSTAD